MRQAPAIRLDTVAPLSWRLVQAVLPGTAAAALAAWLVSMVLQPGPAVVAAAVVAGCASALVGWWRARPRPTTVDWDGAGWTLDPGTARALPLARLEVMVDLDRLLLLRATAAAPRRDVRWLAVALGRDPARERALCAALHGGHGPAAGDLPPRLHG